MKIIPAMEPAMEPAKNDDQKTLHKNIKVQKKYLNLA